jgi:GT2 family glycosyltransferase
MQQPEWQQPDVDEEEWALPEPPPNPELDYSRRPQVRGKFLFLGEHKYWVKGVTYGTFRPGDDGKQFPARGVVEADFMAMAEAGINTVRIYLPPPVWLLDLAQAHGLRVMVGLAWEQHLTFLDSRKLKRSIEQRVREGVRSCRQHPAVLCYAVGNEIPAPIVRWHGRRKIERFIERLYRAAKHEDPEALVTYVNYPTTEYLQLPFLDLCCFNVYLESEEVLRAYLFRLQNLAGDKPLLMAEIGLDSRRNGDQTQAEQLAWQIRTTFNAACAGSFIFAWTDEWHRGGFDVEDWDFGLVTRDRQPKPALEAVTRAYEEAPFPPNFPWPRISVVVCTFNGAATIRDTLDHLLALDYPDYEVIVVNDGSTDNTGEIISDYKVIPITTENRGLSNARNTGWQAATGQIVAYIDDDAYPDPDWLKFMAHTYLTTDYAAVGGFSPAPPGDGPIADCVANAPGRPVHVLLDNTDAEHIPGCNMSFKRDVLEAIGGFDPRYRTAGDDVDICWRVLEQGWKIGFHPGVLNWHHCRNSIMTYWKQQQGYGKAEALLEEKWPEKYNTAGHLTWRGRLYGKGITQPVPTARWRIYQGQWGQALFQSIYAPSSNMLTSLPLMPEWYFVCWLLAFLALIGLFWPPLLVTVPLLVVAAGAPVVQAVIAGTKAELPTHWPSRWQRFKLHAISAWLHLLQPLARLIGRLRHGLTPWRNHRDEGAGLVGSLFGRTRLRHEIWTETWQSTPECLARLKKLLRAHGARVVAGGDYDAWDLEIRGGLLGAARLVMTAEEHGGGRQMLKFKARSRYSRGGRLVAYLFLGLGLVAVLDQAPLPAIILLGMAGLLIGRARYETVGCVVGARRGLKELQQALANASH